MTAADTRCHFYKRCVDSRGQWAWDVLLDAGDGRLTRLEERLVKAVQRRKWARYLSLAPWLDVRLRLDRSRNQGERNNYPRLADWTASARRVASLLVSLERLDRCDLEQGPRHIILGESEGAAVELRDVSVTLDDGSVVVNEAVVEIHCGERVLVEGESGTGKSTLVRAISGLWPWGSGEIILQTGARIFLMPQRPYLPLGTLRRATSYPSSPDEVEDEVVRKALEQVGLGYFLPRLDDDSHWENTLSGGERQRLAFARLLIHRPDIVIMDEATSALDPSSQEHRARSRALAVGFARPAPLPRLLVTTTALCRQLLRPAISGQRQHRWIGPLGA